MWENRCKVAVSGVGFSKVTRSAEIPLAAHALEAVKGAVADSGLEMSDIDGLATYPELPATGHAEIDGVTIGTGNIAAFLLKLTEGATRDHDSVSSPEDFFQMIDGLRLFELGNDRDIAPVRGDDSLDSGDIGGGTDEGEGNGVDAVL